MLTEIEQFILGGNTAHDIFEFSHNGSTWTMVVESHAAGDESKVFIFDEVEIEYEQVLLDEGENLEYPLPIIGFECRPTGNDRWRFMLNASDAEWAFISKWPVKI